MKRIIAVVRGPAMRKYIYDLPDGVQQPISQTFALVVYDDELDEFLFEFVDKVPIGTHLQDFPIVSVQDAAEIDLLLTPQTWANFAKSGSRTKVGVINVDDLIIKRGGDPTYRIKRHAYSC